MTQVRQLTPRADTIGKKKTSTVHYKKDYFKWWYDADALGNILAPAKGTWVAQSDVLWNIFLEIQKDLQKVNKVHKWTWAEDEFIRHNYRLLSDNIIGLALNIPGRIVKLRRLRLGLKKIQPKDTYKVVIWCERSDYEKHVNDYTSKGVLPSKTRKEYNVQ